MRELHLFAGAGGGLLSSLLLGHRPVCAVEIDPYCRAVLQARRDEGWLPAEMEIHDDVTTFDGHAWRGRIDLVAGGFPCQDISVAGKGAGLEGARSGLFYELLRVVREVRPKWVYLENVPAITSRGLDRVLGALADMGFDAEWCVLSAADAGAPHLRKRWWCLARLADANDTGRQQQRLAVADEARYDAAECSRGRPAERRLGRTPDGLAEWLDATARGYWSGDWETQPRLAQGQPHRVARLRALGNGQVPQTAAMAFQVLMKRFGEM